MLIGPKKKKKKKNHSGICAGSLWQLIIVFKIVSKAHYASQSTSNKNTDAAITIRHTLGEEVKGAIQPAYFMTIRMLA